MATMNDVVRLGIDICEGKPTGTYSADQAHETFRKALIDANGGKDHLDVKDIRDGKCSETFAIIEEIVTKTVVDGLQGNEFFMNFVEYRNLKLGDKNEFYYPDDSLFYVDSVARGTQGLRRQRMSGGRKFSVPIENYGVKIYEELDRILSGRASLTENIEKVGRSIQKKQYDDIFAKWTSMVTPGAGTTYIPVAGNYDEEALLTLCEHVEVNTGAVPVIMGTRAALRKCTTAIVSDSAKESMYNIGYYGRFNGIPMVRINQVHATNTSTFILPENQLYIVGVTNGYKPIKYVNEGDSLIVPPGFAINGDFSEDYLFINKAGVEIVLPDKQIGVYTIR